MSKEIIVVRCTKCKSEQIVKAGFHHRKQRYKCKECGRQFTRFKDKNATKRAFALYLYVVGLSMNSIARMFEVETSTVLYWVRNFALKTGS
jgi:transposase-like protein